MPEATRIATANGAQFLGEAERIGTIAAGEAADLVVIHGNPASTIADIEKVEFVFEDAIGYDSSKLIDSARSRMACVDALCPCAALKAQEPHCARRRLHVRMTIGMQFSGATNPSYISFKFLMDWGHNSVCLLSQTTSALVPGESRARPSLHRSSALFSSTCDRIPVPTRGKAGSFSSGPWPRDSH